VLGGLDHEVAEARIERGLERVDLDKLGDSAASALRKALREGRPLEVRQRIEHLLARLDDESLRISRAMEVLERISSAEAHRLLQALAGGADGARLTREARAGLTRRLPVTNP
jgi:hypothetical protein